MTTSQLLPAPAATAAPARSLDPAAVAPAPRWAVRAAHLAAVTVSYHRRHGAASTI